MSLNVISRVVEKVQIWFICASLGFILWFGRDVYQNVKESHDMSLTMKQRQDDMQRTLDRHEELFSQLKTNR